jgi:protoporphyrinogen/coproporphyrinogen III oxidase
VNDSTASKRIAILGAGISGLSAAAFLSKRFPEARIDILEASDRIGGVLHTETLDGLLIEHSADNFATNTGYVSRLHECLGIAPELIRPNENYRWASVVCRGNLQPIPVGFSMLQPTRLRSVLQSPILSWSGKARLVAEQWISRRTSLEDESLESFAVRRLGREVFERLVEPIVCGIFTAKADQLSMQAALPQFVAMEREHGSLIRAARAKRKSDEAQTDSAREATGARYDIFAAPRGGMTSWIDQIAAALPTNVSIKLCHLVTAISPLDDHRWQIAVQNDAPKNIDYDACIVALNAPITAKLLPSGLEKASQALSKTDYASSIVAIFAFPLNQLLEAKRCFGVVVPQVEHREVLAISLSSLKYAGRCAGDLCIARVFLGGAVRPDLMNRDDGQLVEVAWRETQALLGIKSSYVQSQLIHWNESMPQYTLGHMERLRIIAEALADYPTLKLCGNAYRGVGIPQCIASGERAANALFLTS